MGMILQVVWSVFEGRGVNGIRFWRDETMQIYGNFEVYTRVSIEVSNYLVSWLFHLFTGLTGIMNQLPN